MEALEVFAERISVPLWEWFRGSVSAPLENMSSALAPDKTHDHDCFLQAATEQLSRLIGVRRCTLLVQRDGRLFHGGAIGLPSAFVEAIDGLPISPDQAACGAAAALERPVVTADIRTDPTWSRLRPLAEAAGLRACWSVPLSLPQGGTLGTFASYSEQPLEPTPEEIELARAHGSLVAIGLDSLRHKGEMAERYEAIVAAMLKALDARDEYTGAHSVATAALAVRIGRRLGVDEQGLGELERAAVLHDIGKLGIPTEILHATRPLTLQERRIVERHPVIGEQILVGVADMKPVARAVRHEHERWDGDGYPDGLSGDEIPLASRIVLVCDSWHAMTSDRPYRTALDYEKARAELEENAGTQFDPETTAALIGLLDETRDASPVPSSPRFRRAGAI